MSRGSILAHTLVHFEYCGDLEVFELRNNQVEFFSVSGKTVLYLVELFPVLNNNDD